MSRNMLTRVLSLQRYMDAVESGDIETVATMLQDAEQDRPLERMILEVNAGYQSEDGTSVQDEDVVRAQQLLMQLVDQPLANQPRRRDAMSSPLFHADDDAADVPTDVANEQTIETELPVQESPGRKALAPVFPARMVAQQKWYRSSKSWIAAAVAAVLLSFILFQGNSVVASQFFSFFRIQQFKPVQVTNTDITGLAKYSAPSIDDLGSVTFQRQSFQQRNNLTQAQVAHDIDFSLTLPQQLPPNVGNNPTFSVIGGAQGVFTFSSAKVHAYLVKNGHSNVQIPANLDGATFDVKTTPGVLAQYGYSTGNPFVIVEMPSPLIQATGKASLQNLRDFMLSLPNLPPQLVAQLKQLDLNSGTIPLPVPAGIQTQSVTVHNVPGLLLSSSKTQTVENVEKFPAGNMLVWQENGIIYALGGVTINPQQLLAAANSLH